MKRVLLFMLLFSGLMMGQNLPQCNFHTATAHNAAGLYVGNASAGRFILIGTINVPTPCWTNKVSFNASHIDSVSLSNTYEMSLYCINGDCPPLQRVLDTGLLYTAQFFSNCPSGDYTSCIIKKNGNSQYYALYGQAVQVIPWVEGETLLLTGNYALAMGTSCADGLQGGGGGNCGQAYGEGGADSEAFAFKIFTGNPAYTKSMVWDNGLPSALPVAPIDKPWSQAPHMIDYTIYDDNTN